MMMYLISDYLIIIFHDLFNVFFVYLAYNPKVPERYKWILGKNNIKW